MEQSRNEIYALVDEEFLSKYSDNHLAFMKDYYYKYYCKFCKRVKRKPLSQNEFYRNMHRRRIQLYQLCCPYCGGINILIYDKMRQGIEGPNYCPHCGKGSTIENIFEQIARFIRIRGIHGLGLKELKIEHPDAEEWLLAYDCYQMELIELASIIEVIFRDYFEALFCINNFGEKGKYTNYIKKVFNRHHGNDFMNIDKANSIYKKAFGINLKAELDAEVWNDLIDIVNLRNMMVHNNGKVDAHFKTTPSNSRLGNKIEGNLFKLEYEDVSKYLESVVTAVTKITDIFLEKYYLKRNITIANYYFNHVALSSLD